MRPMVTIAVILLLIAVAAVAGWWSRWRFARVEGSFRCKVRALDAPSGLWPHLRRNWPRRRAWAWWIGDTLVTRQGLLSTRKVALVVKPADEGIRGLPTHGVRRWGRRLLVLSLVLPDGSRAELAARESARIAMVGPFLAAAVRALPQAPIGKRKIRRQGW